MFPALLFPLTLIAIAFSFPAWAQDSTVDFGGFFGWLRPYAVELMGLVIAGAIAWATKKFHDLTGIEIEAKHREALQSALRNGANLAIDKIPIGGSIDIRSPAVAAAIRYVLESVPDAVKYFELTPEKIADLLRPKLFAPAAVVVAETT